MNIITIVLDTFRSDIIGPGKNMSFVKTPNLDALAEESVVFEQAYGEGQPTLQVRRAFFTGRRSFPFVYNFDRRGHWHHAPGWHKIPPHQATLSEILTARGYCTGLISDVYHMFKPTMNFWRGFTNYEFIRGQESDNWRGGTPEMVAGRLAKHMRDPSDITAGANLYQYLLNQRFRKSEEDYQCARVFRQASDWLDANGTNKPFMLWVEAFDPHEPWDPPASYADEYCPDYDGIDFIQPGPVDGMSERERERTKALYCGEVTFVDRWVGHLMAKIEALGLKDDTAIVVLSDHGTQVMDHGAFGKGGANLRRYNTGIVWQMYVPKQRHMTIDSLVQSHDVMPTLLEILGIPYDLTDGKSVMPLVRGETDLHRNPIVCGWAEFSTGNAGAVASVRTKEWNYISSVHDTGTEMLFDLTADPNENHDVLAEHPDTAGELRLHIEATVGQPLPAILNEVCDPQPAPMVEYLNKVERVGGSS
jgi:arylsulfatase A-like enzyme